MTRSELLLSTEDSIRNKLLLAARVVWYIVTPVPRNAEGVNQPTVFCCLFHNGKWVFHCDFKNFEKKFSFTREINLLELADSMGPLDKVTVR